MRIIFIAILCVLTHAVGLGQREGARVSYQSEVFPGEDVDEKIRKNFFLRADVSKTECYVGECIMATIKAYCRLDANSNVVSRPALNGFSVIEMVDAYSTFPETELFNGNFYNTHLIRKVQLFALEPGDFVLEPAEVESVVRLVGPRGVFYKNLRLKSPEVSIHVKPLPEKPEDFTGAVGEFSVELRVGKQPVQFEPLLIQLVVSGTGNLPLITDPEISWPVPPEMPEPLVRESFNKYSFPLEGQKLFEYKLPSRDTGSYTIPPVKFTYFDPLKGQFRTVASNELKYTVKPAAGQPFNAEELSTQVQHKPFPLDYFYFGIVALAILLVIVTQLIRFRKR